MNFLSRIFVIWALVFCVSISNASADNCCQVLIDNGFHVVDLDKIDLSNANRSNEIFFIDRNEKTKKIEIDNVIKRQGISGIDAGDVQYLGTNRGEWGGYLTAKLSDGTVKSLISDNIISLIPHENDLYAFTGMSHMSINRGAVYKISDYKSNPVVEKVTLLPQIPRAVIIRKTKIKALEFLIVTSSGVTLLTPERKDMKVLSTKLFWGGLYPNSVVQQGDYFYIGMRSGLASFKVDSSAFARMSGGLVSDIKYFTK